MIRIHLYLFLLAFLFQRDIVYAQNISTDELENLEVSILTCGPGDDLYSLFGHTALRLKDSNLGIDIVYNWGTFDFNAPNFGIKFLRGQLPYALSVSRHDSFLMSYEYDRRWVEQQSLSLSPASKARIIAVLDQNVKIENRFYKYDFYFDNCTTRIRDIIERELGPVSYPILNDTSKTFRNLLHENLEHHPWTKFGMDIILGTLSDQLASVRGQMFLPIYFRDYMDGAKNNAQNLVLNKTQILRFNPQSVNNFWLTPVRLFSILLVIELLGFFLFYISGDRGFLIWYDFIWWIALCASSLIFLFMWFGTDHEVCANNWNLLWASPWMLLYFFNKKVLKKCCLFLTLIVSLCILAGWTFVPQELHIAIVPLVLINLLKSLRISGFKKWVDKNRKLKAAVLLFFLCVGNISAQNKIGGITMVSPPRAFSSDPMAEISHTNANWVALVPFGFSRKGQPEVNFGSTHQWWGERIEGVTESLKLAKKNGLKVMLKPQVWIPEGWVGEMDFDTETDWIKWEESYRSYIMTFVKLASAHDVEMICIGTEYRISILKREKYWRKLIEDIRTSYTGKLTYSSNWDSYEKVPFWDALDYIGISAYFPLSDVDTPPTLLLSYRWNKHVKRLEKISEKLQKKILFTEYGYLSVDGAAGKTWELEKQVKSLNINEQAQANGYEALFSAFWHKDFWAGGFLWKWFPEGSGHEGYPERDYTPQNKKASKILNLWYAKQ